MSGSNGSPSVLVRGVKKTFGTAGAAVQALRGVNMEIKPGQLVMLVGPSGCGKTTLVSVISGVLDADGYRPVDPQGPARVEEAVRAQVDRREPYAHHRRDTAQGHAGTGNERVEQHVTGAGVAAVTTGRSVQPGSHRTRPTVHGARDAVVAEAPVGLQRRPGRVRVGPVRGLQRGLDLAQSGGIHGSSMELISGQDRPLRRQDERCLDAAGTGAPSPAS